MALALAGTMMAGAPAQAQPLVTGGVVNVTVVDLLDAGNILSNNNVSVGAALGIAATVCDVQILAVQLRQGTTTCTSDAGDQQVTISQIQ